MGKKEAEGGSLGRALVKQHNQMVRLSKEKGHLLGRHNRRVLQSVTDVSDIDAVVEQADAAHLLYLADNPVPQLLVDRSDAESVASELTWEERRRLQKEEEALHASSLRIPRRPPWDAKMSTEELEETENHSFLAWRRSLARLEENERLVLTPFEKNLDIWRQLWRVLERSDLVVMVVDARDPLFYRCPDLEAYAREIDEHKRTMLLVNKADLLPVPLRRKWADYFKHHGILFIFWSAKAASAALERKKLSSSHWVDQEISSEHVLGSETKIYGRVELLARLQLEAEIIAENRKKALELKCMDGSSYSTHVNEGSHLKGGSVSFAKQVTVGFVGYPNVGKSSTINALVGEKRTGVTSTPGKTKHFQTLIINDRLVLCDCPGLVFPSFSSSRYEMIASGVLPIDRMTEHREAVQVVANRVPSHALESIYNITLPNPKPYEPQDRPPLASELLRVYCASRGYVGSSGLPDETRAARQILKDYLDGKLPHFEMPPGMSIDEGNEETDSSLEDIDGEEAPVPLDDGDQDQGAKATGGGEDGLTTPFLNDLKLFDNTSGMVPTVGKKKASADRGDSSHKHHKKPQRKKDRSWRVQNDNEDGMPVVRVFQKPAVNLKLSG